MSKLDTDYHSLHYSKRRLLREQYILEQDNKCFYCKEDIRQPPPKRITDKTINWDLFPDNFLKYPVHLQHNHTTGLTEGAVHSYCNAVMWQYEHK